MNTTTCDIVRERIPDYVANRLPRASGAEVEGHLLSCESCREEADLAQMILASRPTVPAGLALRVQESVRNDRASVRRPWWAVSAAAVATLALGIGLSNSVPSQSAVPAYAYETELSEPWLGDDGLIAGAPSLEGLTDEALADLLNELTVGGAGGSA